jgi:hypothetical protein
MKWLALIITLLISLFSDYDFTPDPSPLKSHQEKSIETNDSTILKTRQKMMREWRAKYGVPITGEVER